METERELVSKAIAFENPRRVPIWLFNRDQETGDVLCTSLSRIENGRSEWGYQLVMRGDGTMGYPDCAVLSAGADLDGFTTPQLNREARLAALGKFVHHAGSKYRLGSLILSGFTVYTLLRGFATALMDFVERSVPAMRLFDRILEFEDQLIDLAAQAGLDGVHFADDWASQADLFISPTMWRELFKPRYRRQFHRARRLGLHVWFHCCGNLTAIAEDLHQIGVDVLNISQPNVVDLDRIGQNLRGHQCFMVPVSYQTTSISGTPLQIQAEAQRLFDLLADPKGGLVGYVEDYRAMGMSEENYAACITAFRYLSSQPAIDK